MTNDIRAIHEHLLSLLDASHATTVLDLERGRRRRAPFRGSKPAGPLGKWLLTVGVRGEAPRHGIWGGR